MSKHGKTKSMGLVAAQEPQPTESEDVYALLRESPPNILEWLLREHETKTLIKCRVDRERVDDGTMYTFVVEELSMPVMIVKQRKRGSSHMAMTLPGDRRVEKPLYTLRHNRRATEFALQHAEKSKGGDLAAVNYKLSDRDDVPRQILVLLPTVEARFKEQLLSLLKSYHAKKETDKYVAFHNKEPVWREDIKANVLNFGGRVKKASMKNFQIVSDDNTDDVLMQFGRCAKDSFILDFKAPFCPLQALAVALSSFN